MSRKFEKCKDYLAEDITLPTRATKHSAGYDFASSVDIKIPSFWENIQTAIRNSDGSIKTTIETILKPTLVGTGIKVKMENDEYLALYNRSSNPIKKFLLLANGVGVVDADYYSNPSNDGEIKFAFWNLGVFSLDIKKGDIIGQGVFHKFLIVDEDIPRDVNREGGFGSTTK